MAKDFGQIQVLNDGTVEVLGTCFPLDRSAPLDGKVEAFVRPLELEVLNREQGQGSPALVKAAYPFADSVIFELGLEGHKNTVEIRIPTDLWDTGEITSGQCLFVRPKNVRICAA